MKTNWHKGTLTYESPKVMGILNATPDSFSDGGRSRKELIEHAFSMIDAGADIIDIGGESTRPGSEPVSADVEIERILPILKELLPSVSVPISVDTMKTEVAVAALGVGADIINDVNGLRSEGMMDAIASAGVPVVIMHENGTPETTHRDIMTGDAIPHIVAFLKNQCNAALESGIKEIVVDPGIGFGKTDEQNTAIMNNASKFDLGYPVLIGASRKRFLSHAFPNVDRETASVNAAICAVRNGANIVRVHNVNDTVKALRRTF